MLGGRDWIMVDYTIGDIAIAPWLRSLRDSYGAGDYVGWTEFPRSEAYLNRFLERPAVQRGLDFAKRA